MFCLAHRKAQALHLSVQSIESYLENGILTGNRNTVEMVSNYSAKKSHLLCVCCKLFSWKWRQIMIQIESRIKHDSIFPRLIWRFPIHGGTPKSSKSWMTILVLKQPWRRRQATDSLRPWPQRAASWWRLDQILWWVELPPGQNMDADVQKNNKNGNV